MLKFISYGVDIDIQLDKGVYVFSSYSASGKSYLLFLLDAIKDDENILTYTYKDYKADVDLGKLLSNRSYDLVLIDRYDLYLDKFSNAIVNAGRESLVLIDSKHGLLVEYDTCDIILAKDKVTVKW